MGDTHLDQRPRFNDEEADAVNNSDGVRDVSVRIAGSPQSSLRIYDDLPFCARGISSIHVELHSA